LRRGHFGIQLKQFFEAIAIIFAAAIYIDIDAIENFVVTIF